MADIIVIGGGGHARVVVDVIQTLPGFQLRGFFDGRQRQAIFGVPCLGDDDQLPAWIRSHPGCGAVIGVGSVAVEDRRTGLFQLLKDLGFGLPPVVAAAAVVSLHANIGEGSVVLPGAVVGPGARIGKGVIVNTGCSVDHDCVIGDFAHLAPGVTVCGGVRIGAGSFIGAGSTVIQGRQIGVNCLVGAGAVVIDDIMTAGTYVGQPARRMG